MYSTVGTVLFSTTASLKVQYGGYGIIAYTIAFFNVQYSEYGIICLLQPP